MCEGVAGVLAGPSSAEEPSAAGMQPSMERSGSLPPAACLAAARSNFLCIVPNAAIPCASPRALHSQGPHAEHSRRHPSSLD